jgi:hypothetical protein
VRPARPIRKAVVTGSSWWTWPKVKLRRNVPSVLGGRFGYVRTPIHFEHLVLAALQESTDTGSWSKILQRRIAAIAGDDAAMAVLGVGADHDEFRRLFAPRTAEIEQRCIMPLDELEAEVCRAEQAVAEARSRHAAVQTSLWAQYKTGYERYLGREEGR